MEKIMRQKISEFMKKKVISVVPEESIKNVFKLMDKHGILGVPVVDKEGVLVGIVTESDLLSHFTTINTPVAISLLGSLIYLDSLKDFNEKLKDHCAELVKDIMSTTVVTIGEEQTLSDVVDLMAEKEISRLPVVDKKGKLSGIVTRSDVVHQLARQKIV